MPAGKILVVDDLPDWRITLSGLLMDQGYDVQTASSIDNALEILEKEYFHVAVLDVRLDETDEDNRDGIQLMHEIKKRRPSTEIIILTGYADVSMIQEAMNPNYEGGSAAFCFLEKEKMNDLVDRVSKACEKSDDYMFRLIAQGENERVEFKSSIRWDYKKENPVKYLQAPIAKAMAGMMNHQGGKLFIGVDDNGNVLGIEKDLQVIRNKNTDGFQVALTDIVQNFLGLEYLKLIHVRFELVENKQVCIVSIDPSPTPVYFETGNKSEFWVRVGNATHQLDVKDATKYIQTHWVEKK